MPGEHTWFSPSASERWMSCTGSVTLPQVDDSSAYADRGTDLHKVSEMVLKRAEELQPTLHAWISFVVECILDIELEQAATLKPLSYDEVQAVQHYTEFCYRLPGVKLFEVRSLFVEDCGGVSDTVAIYQDPNGEFVLHIVDAKFGSGFAVSPIENTQLMIYGLGMKRKLEPLLGDFDTVRLTIVQPLCSEVWDEHGPWTWETSADDLEQRGEHIAAVVSRTKAGERIEFVPTEPNCRWCKAKTACQAFEQVAIAAGRDAWASEVQGARDLTRIPQKTLEATERLDWKQRLELAPIVRAWANHMEAEAKEMLLRGDDRVAGCGFKVVMGKRGNRTFTDEVDVEAVLDNAGFKPRDTYTEPKLKTPTQIEKVVKAAGGDDVSDTLRKLKSLTYQAAGRPTIAPDDDKRPELSATSLAENAFADEVTTAKAEAAESAEAEKD